jgi:hypothetical protein
MELGRDARCVLDASMIDQRFAPCARWTMPASKGLQRGVAQCTHEPVASGLVRAGDVDSAGCLVDPAVAGDSQAGTASGVAVR